MKMRLILLFFLCLFPIGYLWAQGIGNTPLKPLGKTRSEALKVVEGQLYCHGGYGGQNHQFKIGGKNVRSEQSSSYSFIPDLNLQDNLVVGFGCLINNIFFDYSLSSGSVKLNEEFRENGTDYNTIKYEISFYNLGYQFSLIPHTLYLGTGISYHSIDYKLGMYGGSASSEYSADSEQTSGYGGMMKMQWFINHFFFLDYEFQKSFSSGDILSASSRLGLNFYSRF